MLPLQGDLLKSQRRRMKMRLMTNEGWQCQMCDGRPGTDMHEIISRARCRGSWDALYQVCQQIELCALLCRQCHERVDDALLIGKKIEKYGRDSVEKAFKNVNKNLTVNIRIEEYE